MKPAFEMTEDGIREKMAAVARSLFQRGYSFGTSGNISARHGGEILITPTGSSFESLRPDAIARVSLDGGTLGPAKPSKEAPFHLAIYHARPEAGAVVHLHSTYAVAVSCLAGLNLEDALPVLTPYYAMRIGRLPVVDYYPPGDARLAPAVEEVAQGVNALLLRNHGPVTFGKDLAEAAALAEELEEHAKLYFLLGERARPLEAGRIRELRERFG